MPLRFESNRHEGQPTPESERPQLEMEFPEYAQRCGCCGHWDAYIFEEAGCET